MTNHPTVTVVSQTANIADAKKLGDSSPVGLVSKTVTAMFSDHLYVEEMDRSSGIKVLPVEMPSGVTVGVTRVNVCGVLQTQADGERCVMYASVTVE